MKFIVLLLGIIVTFFVTILEPPRVLLEILGGSVPLSSPNPDPIQSHLRKQRDS